MAKASDAPAAPRPDRAARAAARASGATAEANKKENAPKPAATKKRAAEAAPADASKKAKPAADAKEVKEAASSGGKLKVGDPMPDITLKTQDDKEVKIADLKKAIIFAVPKANTPGCTTQACNFRDDSSKYTDAGFTVYSLSNDNLTPLKTWKSKQSLQYDLLSDPQRELIGRLTGSKSSTTRSHFVIDSHGKLALSSVGVKPKESSETVLAFINENKSKL